MGDFFIHEKALVETNSIGKGTTIWAFAHVMKEVTIGEECNVGDHVFIETGVTIGDGVTVKNNVLLWKGVSVADYVFIGPNVVFTNDLRPRSPRMPLMREHPMAESDWLVETEVCEGASIGANSTILAGITIGEYSMIGAGSVVTKDVPPYALVVGNPAKLVGRVDRYGKQSDEQA